MKMKYIKNIRGLSSKLLILFLFLMSSQKELRGQCRINEVCDLGELISPPGVFCLGTNPRIARMNLGWGINFDTIRNTYNYTDEFGVLKRIPSHFGLIRTIHVRVPFPNRRRKDPQWLYLSKDYYYNITMESRTNGNNAIVPKINNSCWSTNGTSHALWDIQQRAFNRGRVTGLSWINGMPSGICRRQERENLKASVADRPISREIIQTVDAMALSPITLNWITTTGIPVVTNIFGFNRLFNPCPDVNVLCIQIQNTTAPLVPLNISGVLYAFTLNNNNEIISQRQIAVVPINLPDGNPINISIPFTLASNEYIDFFTQNIGNTVNTFFIEYPADTGNQKSIRTGNTNYVRSPDNICLIADRNGDDIWDDFPQPGIDY